MARGSSASGGRRLRGGVSYVVPLGQTGDVDLLAPANYLLLGLNYVLLALAVWALVDALLRPAAAFPAAGKLTKPAWVAILVVCVGLCLITRSALALLGLASAVAVIVYLVDVRPAVRELGGGRGPWR